MTPTSANSVAVHVENMTKKKRISNQPWTMTQITWSGAATKCEGTTPNSDYWTPGLKKIALFPCVLFPLLLVAELTTGSCWH